MKQRQMGQWDAFIPTLLRTLGLLSLLLFPLHAQATPSSQPTSLPKARAAAHLAPISCRLTKAELAQKRRLLTASRITDIPGMIATLSWATNKGWFKRLNVQKLQSVKGFLEGKMIKWLGIQWKQGIWVTVHERNHPQKTLSVPFTWMPIQQKGVNWPLLTKSLERLEITVSVAIQKSYWLTLALRQLLNLSGQTSYKAKISGYTTYWIQLRNGTAAVLLVKPSRLLLRFLWRDDNIDSNAGRQKRWQLGVKSMLDAHEDRAFIKVRQTINNSFPSLTNGIAYAKPRVLCHWLSPLPFPFKRHILKTLAIDKAYAVGARATPTAVRVDLKRWPATTTTPVQQPPQLLQWPQATARWVTTIDARPYPLHQLYGLFSTPRSDSFYARLKNGLGKALAARGLAPAGVSFWRQTWQQWWLESIMFQRVITWMESPTVTSEGERKPHGYLATGVWPKGTKAIMLAAFQHTKGLTKTTADGAPVYIAKQTNGTSIAFTWIGRRWFAASRADLLSRLTQQAKSKTKGSLLRFAKNGSLLNLQSWNKGWNIIHLNPARMGCLWNQYLPDKAAKAIAKHVEMIEIGSLLAPQQESITLRIGWKHGGLLPPKTPYPACWDQAPWWRRLGAIGWVLPLRSPLVQMLRTMLLPLLPKWKYELRIYRDVLDGKRKMPKPI